MFLASALTLEFQGLALEEAFQMMFHQLLYFLQLKHYIKEFQEFGGTICLKLDRRLGQHNLSEA